MLLTWIYQCLDVSACTFGLLRQNHDREELSSAACNAPSLLELPTALSAG